MKQKRTLVILLLVIVLLLGGGTFASRTLSRLTEPTVPYAPSAQSDLTGEAQESAPAPDFTVYNADGSTVALSEKQGKPVFINFWATWCPPCRSELADINKAYETYGDRIEFMMVDLTDGYNGEDQPTVEAFVAENGYTFPVYFDLDSSAAMAYGVRSIPTTVLVAADGTLLHTQMGAMSESQIEQLMQSLLGA